MTQHHESKYAAKKRNNGKTALSRASASFRFGAWKHLTLDEFRTNYCALHPFARNEEINNAYRNMRHELIEDSRPALA